MPKYYIRDAADPKKIKLMSDMLISEGLDFIMPNSGSFPQKFESAAWGNESIEVRMHDEDLNIQIETKDYYGSLSNDPKKELIRKIMGCVGVNVVFDSSGKFYYDRSEFLSPAEANIASMLDTYAKYAFNASRRPAGYPGHVFK